jgi:hypothetical protein
MRLSTTRFAPVDLINENPRVSSFLKYMNPFICQFDPQLHTLRYIRSRSSFLVSALLSAAAKVFSPSLYTKLHDHVESLLREVLGSGQKSTEIVQGICILTYWKEPSDSRAWLLVGYAIRASIEMGWHKLRQPSFDPKAPVKSEPAETELEIRERRNKERTWLMLFVYDRRCVLTYVSVYAFNPCMFQYTAFRLTELSVSLQLGKPWMIQIDPLIRNSESWHQDIYAVPGCDQIMSAFVQLRILGSEILDLFWIDPLAPTPDAISKAEVFIKLFNGELDRWQAKWYKILEDRKFLPSPSPPGARGGAGAKHKTPGTPSFLFLFLFFLSLSFPLSFSSPTLSFVSCMREPNVAETHTKSSQCQRVPSFYHSILRGAFTSPVTFVPIANFDAQRDHFQTSSMDVLHKLP